MRDGGVGDVWIDFEDFRRVVRLAVQGARGGGALSRARGARGIAERGRDCGAVRADGVRREDGNASGGVSGDVLCQMRDARVVNLHGHRAFAHGRRVQSHSALPESRASLHGARGAGRVAVRHTVLGADVVASRHVGDARNRRQALRGWVGRRLRRWAHRGPVDGVGTVRGRINVDEKRSHVQSSVRTHEKRFDKSRRIKVGV